MSQETEWAEGRSPLQTPEAKEQRAKLAERLLFWGGLACLGVLAGLALGCASKDDGVWNRVCYEKPLGQTEQGLLVVQHSCVTLEAFTAANR